MTDRSAGVQLHVVSSDEWETHRALRLEMLLDAPDAFETTHAEAVALGEEQWRERICGTFHVMATLDGEPVGSVGLWPGREPDPDGTNLIAMYVAPRARGQGVGERLVAAVLDEAVLQGRRRVHLEVTSSNHPAIRLYERMGFVFTGATTPHPRRGDLVERAMEWATSTERTAVTERTAASVRPHAPSPRILVVGPASWNLVVHLDRLPDPRPQTVFARRSTSTLGGTSAGKALNLASLGADVTLAAAIGSDREGELIEAALAAAGVATVVVRTPGPSERHVNLMDPHGGRVSVYLSLPDLGPQDSSPPPALVEALERADVVVLDLSELSRPLLALARARGIPIWCDVHDYDGRSDYHRDFIAAARVLFLNDDGGIDPSSFMEECRASGTEIVVLTQGAEGATALTADGILHRVAAVPVESVVDTNGAGDAFLSGFLVAHLGGAEVDAALCAGAEQAARCLASPDLAPVPNTGVAQAVQR